MQNKIKNIIVITEFLFILLILLIINIVKKDDQISVQERRKLAKFPQFTVSSIFNGQTSTDIDNYVTDQFVARDFFKRTKYWFSTNIFKEKDNNKLFVKDGAIYKMDYPLNETAINCSAEKIKNIYEKYLQGMNVYFSIIPDKNYYLNDEHLTVDYEKLENIMKEKLINFNYIDIKQSLNSNDFYKTDLHWKQENILSCANVLKENMNLSNCNLNDYVIKKAGNFFGVYYGTVSTKIEPDVIRYLTNDTLENCTTYNYETDKFGKVYDLEKFNKSSDKYDLFLSGPTPLISIENPNSNTKKELLLFRDSFGSSIAPLFVQDYAKITLIDLRYIKPDLLKNYIDFNNQDVLFLYSGVVLNQNIFR